MKDIRFKVSTALAEAGLANTAYAKELVKGMGNSGAQARTGANIGSVFN